MSNLQKNNTSTVGDRMPRAEPAKKPPGLRDLTARLVKEKPLGAIGGFIVLALLLVGILADLVAPYGNSEIDLQVRLAAPSAQHLLGTDQLGRDLLSRIIYGARVSLVIGLASSCISVLVAIVLGALSGFIGGKLDLIVQRLVDAIMAFPGLLFLIMMMSLVGRGLLQIILVLGVLNGISGSRIARSAVIEILRNTYITAARAIGGSSMRTFVRHVLPNIMAPMIIVFSTSIGSIILSEASLSFLGFGLPPDVASWGGMLSIEGRRYMEMAPRLALWPGIALSVVIFGTNMFGDALRDLLDPRLRGGVGGLGERGMLLARKALRKKEARAGRRIQL
jgi:peptide/nickel transport system permease protein